MGLKISAKGVLMVSIPLVLNVTIVGVFAYLLVQEEYSTRCESRAKEFNLLGSRLYSELVEPPLIAWRYAISPNPVTAKKFDRSLADLAQTLQQLQDLAEDDQQRKTIENLHRLEDRLFVIVRAAKCATDQGRDGLALMQELQIQYEFDMLTRQCFAELESLISDGRQRELQSQHSSNSLKATLKSVIVWGFLANIALSIWLAIFFGKTISFRLKVLQDQIQRLRSYEELSAQIAGDDEIAVLGKAYRHMSHLLAEGHRRERILFDDSRDVICTLDDSFAFTNVNQACEQVWGYHPDELMGRKIDALIEPQERATVDRLSVIRQENGDGEETVEFENRVVHKRGNAVHMLWSAHWSKDERTYFCVAHDITARTNAEELLKNSEARVRTIIESLPICLLILNGAGIIESANEKAGKLLARDSAAIMGSSLASFTSHEGITDEEFLHRLKERSFQQVEEISCITDKNGNVPCELSSTRLNYRGEEKLLVVLVDTRERKEIEQARQELINMVSHDLRTPLSGVLSIMELLLAGVLGRLNQYDEEQVSACVHELERLVVVLNGLLDLERIKAKVLMLDREVDVFSNILERAIQTTSRLAEEHGIQVSRQISDCELICDSARLTQAIVHLLSDAIRKLPAGSGIVVLSAIDECLTVTLKTIKPQSQSDSNRQEQSSAYSTSSNVGLLVSSGVITAHNGSLHLNGSGEIHSSFILPLPRE